MEFDISTIYMIVVIYIVFAIIGWFISGRKSYYTEITIFLFSSIAMTFLSLLVQDKLLMFGGFLTAGIIFLVLAIRMRSHFSYPANVILNEHIRMKENKDFSIKSNPKLSDKSKILIEIYESEHQLMNQVREMFNMIAFAMNSETRIVEDLLSVSSQLDESSDKNSNLIDELIKSIIAFNDLSNELKTKLDEISGVIADAFHYLNREIISVDKLSDQATLIAVNANIEVAHKDNEAKNFEIVAQGIQTLSNKFRETSNKLTRSSVDFNKQLQRHMSELGRIGTKIDKDIMKIADISDQLSLSSNNYGQYVMNIKSSVNQIHESLKMVISEISEYKI